MPVQFAPQPSRPNPATAYPSDPNLALTYDTHAGDLHADHQHPQAMMQPHQAGEDPLGIASAWVSTGFGLVQLLAPRLFLRAVGMPYPPWLIQLIGARDLVIGMGLIGRPDSPAWRRARFVNDMLDTTVIGAAYARSPDRRRLTAFAALAAGVVMLDAASSEAAHRQE